MGELITQHEPLVRGMLENNIVKFGGPFSLKDGRPSLAYVNLRDIISMPRLFTAARNAYVDALRGSDLLYGPDDQPRYLAGIPEAAMYYTGAVAAELHAPLVQHRVKAKHHGQPRAVEGRFESGDEVVLLDDVITSAGSKLTEIIDLGNFGLQVTGVAVLVYRQQGGRTELEAQGLEFAAALSLGGIAKYALDHHMAGVTHMLYDDMMAELEPSEL